ncbi:uncharacterized protein LOC122313920 isoform X1 [Carya illinoinensis]|uniref:Uncharacterized protein n=1 Tax=Carya illinoinensis TaxID=32201 RepID=A0A8T1QAM8_CARIL|nr:uncharacterized protein LOC122313920 isoform X1 [Carya illinoinensis]KAG6651362.1 hypothetical protein CIPAW_06G105500 [Carya illinoinensis]
MGGKLLCDSTTVAETFQTSSPTVPWRDPQSAAAARDAIEAVDLVDQTTTTAWDDVHGLEEQQRRHLQRLHSKGILWKHPADDSASSVSVVFRLSHGGEVSADGNCLFTASQKAMGGSGTARVFDARELRRRTVRRFLEDFGSVGAEEREAIEEAIKHMYAPDLKNGWGIHVVQELKLLAKKSDRLALDSAIDELLQLGVQREMAAESIYKERCIPVNDGPSWAKYMSISGSSDDEYDIITLQYTEEGLLSVDENREGHAAAFGDDVAIGCLATEFKREIYVVQAHGSDAMVEEENCVFFLPHRPRGQICEPPLFLFMKGTGWCGAGADHYEPLIAHPSTYASQEKVALVL